MRALDVRRAVRGPVELVVLAAEPRRWNRPELFDHLESFGEPLQTFITAPEVDAVAPLGVWPSGPDPELDPAVRDVIERGDDLRGERWVSVDIAGDEQAQPEPRGGLSDSGECRPGFQFRLIGRAVCDEGVGDPERVEVRVLVQLARQSEQLRPRSGCLQ